MVKFGIKVNTKALQSWEIHLNLTIDQTRQMTTTTQPIKFLTMAGECQVIDVRSPGEFEQGHVPGAINIPLFTDAERAVVGTLYVKTGQAEAIFKGLDIALVKVDVYIDSINKVCQKGPVLLHCWRGGLRSAVMAEVFSHAGYEVTVLEGGYKAYRTFIRGEFSRPARVIVLGGYTGSGKTDILKVLAAKGEQVIDLEELACHKGSVFGAMGQPPQPTNEQFENNLYARWAYLDLSRPLWLEDESRMIGRITLPDPVVEQISKGVMIRAGLGPEVRIKRLVSEYAGFDKQMLGDAIRKIGERLGGAGTKEALSALEAGRFDVVASLVLAYYDKAYQFSVSRRINKEVIDIPVSGSDINADADRIFEIVQKRFLHGSDLS